MQMCDSWVRSAAFNSGVDGTFAGFLRTSSTITVLPRGFLGVLPRTKLFCLFIPSSVTSVVRQAATAKVIVDA
jgi:hypothetical protein